MRLICVDFWCLALSVLKSAIKGEANEDVPKTARAAIGDGTEPRESSTGEADPAVIEMRDSSSSRKARTSAHLGLRYPPALSSERVTGGTPACSPASSASSGTPTKRVHRLILLIRRVGDCFRTGTAIAPAWCSSTPSAIAESPRYRYRLHFHSRDR